MSVHKFNEAIAQILNEGPSNHSVRGPVKLQHASPARRKLIDKKTEHEIEANNHRQEASKHISHCEDLAGHCGGNVSVAEHHNDIAQLHQKLSDHHDKLAKHYESVLQGTK